MIFLNAFTQFLTDIFSSSFCAWLMALLVFSMLLSWIIDLNGGVFRD